MLARLERQIIQTIKFKLNPPTALDFLLHYTYGSFADDEALFVCAQSLPWIYFAEMDFEKNRNQ